MGEGKKYDTGKPLLATYYPDMAAAFKAFVKVAEYGAEKYKESKDGERNWEALQDSIPRFKNSLFRHLDKYLLGEKIDEESRHSHLAHIIWNAAILCELERRKDEEETNSISRKIVGL